MVRYSTDSMRMLLLGFNTQLVTDESGVCGMVWCIDVGVESGEGVCRQLHYTFSHNKYSRSTDLHLVVSGVVMNGG